MKFLNSQNPGLRTVAALAAALVVSQARAEFVRGTINGFTAANFMTQDTSFGSIWKATITATNTASAGGLLFDQSGDFAKKWGKGGNAALNSTVGTAHDNGADLDMGFTNGLRYSFNLAGSSSDADRSYVVMETAGNPISIPAVADNHEAQWTNAVTSTIQLSAAKNAQESVWVRFTTNAGFSPSLLIPASGSSTNYSATLPATAGGRAYYYVLTSTMPSNVITSNVDLCTLRGKNAGGSLNYTYSLALGNSWHIPSNAEPSGAYMRNPPTNGVSPSATIYFYNGTYAPDSDQTGGKLVYRLKGSGGWSSNSLAFDSDNGGGNKYWVGSITGGTFQATNEVEYYVKVTYSTNATTYLGTTNNAASTKYGYEADAQARPFSFKYGAVVFNLGNCWHIPTNGEPPGAFMRNPVNPVYVSDTYIYNGNQFAGGGNAGNQTGGTLYYRKVGAGSWSNAALAFDSTQGNNKYWAATIPASTYAAGDAIEYYLAVTYSDRDTTYIGTTNGGVGSATYGYASLAAANPFGFTYSADLGNCWHIPASTEPPGTTMRNPLLDPATNQSVYVYNGNQFQGSGNPGNQTGGRLVYRKAGAGAWLTNDLVFNADSGDVGNNKYWRGRIDAGSYATTNVVEYYVVVTYSDHDTTYLGTTNDDSSIAYANEASAQAHPFTYTYNAEQGLAAAYMWHNDNRVVVNGSNVEFWVKIGYAQGIGTNRYVDYAAIYYTTDGAQPQGAKGQPTNGSTHVVSMQFDHMQEDSYEGGDSMWWVGVVTNLPLFTTVKYKIGAYKTTNDLERFADYNTSGTNDATFTFSLGTLGAQVLTVNGLNADYTTTKFFIDEIAGDSQTVVVVYTPGAAGVTNVEVFSNLDRRDLADVDYTNASISGDGYPDGIKPPDGNLLTVADTGAYFRAWTMTPIGGGDYVWTGRVTRTGAYRLTARFQTTNGSPTWTWYTSEGRRDHAIVASPKKALDMTLYELNALTVEATSADESGRSTFRDLLSTNDVAGDDDSFDPFNLEYLNFIQANCLWFQPIHPAGYERAENDPGTGVPYAPGSPYATKNYWAVNPAMGAADTEAGALAEFTNFVAQCDAYTGSVGRINVMLDGVFNHSSWDAVMGQGGVDLGFTADANARIGTTRPQWYALISDYGEQATYYNSAYVNDFATAPDRGDFGKWSDVTEFYFGKYSALVRHNPENNGDYLNEDDVYDFAGANTNQMDLWKYFAYYPEYWLKKTGYSGTNHWVAAEDDKGIDALRCDFGQGLPPQLWEYIINRTRSKKWNFVFMAETLDGGKPGYRSNRHFDLLNENLVFNFTQSHISDSAQLVSALENRRSGYNGGAILLNLTSHDEVLPSDDPWLNASRYGAVSTVDGLPMVFYGQEQGIKNYNEANPTYDGFVYHELNFGKYVPHFKKWNQLTVWSSPPPDIFGSPPYSGMAQWYGRVNWARHNSPALRSRNRYFLYPMGGGTDSRIFSVAKYEQAGASPATSDVVLAFARFIEHDQPHAGAANTFDLRPAWSLLGLDTNKSYTVRDLASSDAFALFTNGWPQSGQQLYDNGIYVNLPVDTGGSTITNDGALVQYLKIVEVTNAVNRPPVIDLPGPHILALGSSTSFAVSVTDADSNPVTTNYVSGPAGASFSGGLFSWTALPTNFVNTTNLVVFSSDDQQGATNSVVTNSTVIVVPFDFDTDGLGDAWEIGHYGTLTNGADGDTDTDGVNNLGEYIAGTQPTNGGSFFHVQDVANASGLTNRVITVPTEPGRSYTIYYANGTPANDAAWSAFANTNNGVWLETNTGASSHSFVDDETTNTTSSAASGGQRTYHVRVGTP